MKVRHVFHHLSKILKESRHLSQNHVRTLSFWENKKTNDWKRAVSEAEKIVGYPTSFMSLRCLLSDELANVALQVRKLVGTKHPLLKTARGFLDNGKHSLQTRGLMVLLMSKAAGPNEDAFDEHEMVSGIYQSQRQLAEITEMIHTANLVHRGVINLDSWKESDGSYKDMEFGNKIAVLSGDFLLTSAVTGLAELHNTKVVELISTALGDLMSGEFTCLKDRNGNPLLPDTAKFSDWHRQTFLQSGSLLSSSCQAALELAGHDEELQNAAAKFGENIAYAKQMHEDLMPFLKSTNDYNGILSSAPVIKHAEIFGNNSIDTTAHNDQIICIVRNNGEAVEWCIDQCKEYGQQALSALGHFKTSDAKTALTNIVQATTVFKPIKT